MAYEYEKVIKEEMPFSGISQELQEVYRKARAFDEVKEFITRKLKEEEEKSRILLDDYDYGLNQAYNNVDDIIQEHMEDE